MIDAGAAASLMGPGDARAALRAALEGGVEPYRDPRRVTVPTSAGHLLLMPSEHDGLIGMKCVAVGPDNTRVGRPRIQAEYLLYDAASMTLLARIDGTWLTTLRTAAVSALAAETLVPRDAPVRLQVFGAGPQALAHVDALTDLLTVDSVSIVGRRPETVHGMVARLSARGLRARIGVPEEVGEADVVVTATSAPAPVFEAGRLDSRAVVLAVGSHTPEEQELELDVFRGRRVLVEDLGAAVGEAADVSDAVDLGLLAWEDVETLPAALSGDAPATGGAVFRSVGMAWEDLAVARVLLARVASPH